MYRGMEPAGAIPEQFDSHPGRFWHMAEDGRVQCDLCPRFCRLREGQRGL